MTDIQRIDELLEHKRLVLDFCIKLGKRLIQSGEFVMGRQLIANGFTHDHSKFFGIEWECIAAREDIDDPNGIKKATLAMAIHHHNCSNLHHPEHWGNIAKMDRLYIAEMVCDWKARATLFGTSLIDWIESEGMKRWGFTKADTVYQTIMVFVKMLCDEKFSPVQVP